ncbi:hypothetical protein BDY24DRAFT_389443 [Mrakia frigida]|uniref:Cmc4p n=1 Tax=Mrakia frigida TaxID=29902 RepID=UPI003FCC1B9C
MWPLSSSSSASLPPLDDLPVNVRPPNCHPLACKIQTCLSRSHSDYQKCSPEILALYECCEKMYLFTGGTKEGVKGGEGCPSLAVLKVDLKKTEGRGGREFGIGEDGKEMEGMERMRS